MERRKYERLPSRNMIAYTGVDRDHNEMAGSVGRTLNISESGILLETHIPLAPQSNILLEIGLGEDIVSIRGTIVYCKKGRGKSFRSGIAFLDCSGEKNLVVKRYIDGIRRAKKKIA